MLTHCDGVSDRFFHLLWNKDILNKDRSAQINIPQTVIYRNYQATNWYFTDKYGYVKKKKAKRLTQEKILEVFSRNPNASGIAAYFIYNVSKKQKENAVSGHYDIIGKGGEYFYHHARPSGPQPGKLYQPEDPKGMIGQKSVIFYLDYPGLSTFFSVYHHSLNLKVLQGKIERFLTEPNEKWAFGVLQKFEESFGTRNELIEVIWTKHLLITTRRKNKKPLFDKSFDIYERASTFDGPEAYSEIVRPKEKSTIDELQSTLNTIVNHFEKVSYGTICLSFLQCYFKMTSAQELTFLWSTSVRLSKSTTVSKDVERNLPTEFKVHTFKLKDIKDSETKYDLCPNIELRKDFRMVQSVSRNKPQNVQTNDCCFLCNELIDEDHLHSVSYKQLIGFDQRRRDEFEHPPNVFFTNETHTGNGATKGFVRMKKGLIPHTLRRLHPHMGLKEYQSLVNDSTFLALAILVCEKCFLSVVGYERNDLETKQQNRKKYEENRKERENQRFCSIFGQKDFDPFKRSLKITKKLQETKKKEKEKSIPKLKLLRLAGIKESSLHEEENESQKRFQTARSQISEPENYLFRTFRVKTEFKQSALMRSTRENSNIRETTNGSETFNAFSNSASISMDKILEKRPACKENEKHSVQSSKCSKT